MGASFFKLVMRRLATLIATLDYEQSLQNKDDAAHREYPNSRIILVTIAHLCIRFALKLGPWDERLNGLQCALHDYRPSGYDYWDVAQVTEVLENEDSKPITYTAELYREENENN